LIRLLALALAAVPAIAGAAPDPDVRAVPTYESAGLYWLSPGGGSGCRARFRAAGETAWHDGLDLWYDARNAECRGSLVHLKPGKRYEAELGLGRGQLKELWLAATLHDIGKIGVPDRILGKPAPLDAEEVELMKKHPVYGAEIVSHLANPSVLVGVRNHHERIDGRGYPDGLRDDELPLVARIIAVADTFDAMTTSRPYRAGLEREKAAAEIAGAAGTQLCPTVVGAFRRLFDSGRFDLEASEGILRSIYD